MSPPFDLVLPHSRYLSPTQRCLCWPDCCTSVSEKWPGWLKLARTESHRLFAPHDSRQKLCPVTNHTHARTPRPRAHWRGPGRHRKRAFVLFQAISKNGKANKCLCEKNEVQISAREALACRRTAVGHVLRRAHSWHA